jgi:transcription-repair coupling factor (superfamily II helicase)
LRDGAGERFFFSSFALSDIKPVNGRIIMENTAEKTETTSRHRVLYGVPDGFDALKLAELADKAPARTVLHIVLDDLAMARLEEVISFFHPEVEILKFPAWDCLPYDRVSPNSDIMGERVRTLSRLVNSSGDKPRILLTTINAVLQRVPPRGSFENAALDIQVKSRIKPEKLSGFLVENGFHRVDTVREPGEFALRGDIIDIYPPGADQPYRIDLFGDEVEQIRVFDPMSQRTSETVGNVSFTPVSELPLDEDSIRRFRGQYRELFGMPKDNDMLYETVKEGRTHPGMEHWLPLFFDTPLETLFDYVPEATVTMEPQIEQARDSRLKQIQDFYNSRVEMQEAEKKSKISVYNPVPIDSHYPDAAEWDARLADYDVIQFSPFTAPEGQEDAKGRKGRDFGDIRAQPGGDVYQAVTGHVKTLLDQKKRVLISGYSDGARDRLKSVLSEQGLKGAEIVGSWQSAQGMKPRNTGFITLALEHGFEAGKLAIITEQDILGDRLSRPTKKRRKSSEEFLSELSQLSEGDYVVHEEHGIGKFEQLETLEVMGVSHDFLKVVYHGGDRLYVPVESLDVLTRYGSADMIVQLDRLGGAGWQARKAKVKKDLLAMAHQLLKIAADRLLKKTEVIEAQPIEYEKFSAGFPYMETDDQQRAIEDVIEDLSKGQAMDRLVCGDVGFGKTEVALRAAFIMAMAGYQVAVVAPTTLLARQHYQEFIKRFKGFPLRIVQLSRLIKPVEAKRVREEISEGDANIVIGTHALLGKSVKFNHLGLMIVDEEQRFGVKQKERLKELQANVHVLTLTATPIPRTLQMSLTGVKDLSLMATPPIDRLAVRTFIMPTDPVILREALMREHFRSGQSFYVCPRVSDLAEIETFMKELVPELKTITAHGQMDGDELEDRVAAFIDGQYDILLATNIIESGIDIPNVNTIIIHRADMFGLAQLYQLRGRIGRAKMRGYAYLTYAPSKKLAKTAEQRLHVLEQLNTLGAGFQLASHDMDIRGAGNILGEEQSGHVKEVGVELYHQMLEEAVAAVREGRNTDEDDRIGQHSFTPQIELGMPVLIPERYVKDINVRLQLYRRLSDLVGDVEIEGFAAELIDRFGDLPEEVQNLLDVIAIKQLCREAGIAKVEAGPKGAVLSFHNDNCDYANELVAYMADNAGLVKLRPDQKLVFTRVWPENRHRVKGVRKLLQTLVGLKPDTD